MRTIECPKEIKLDFRVDKKENEKLERIAKKLNVKRSEVLRKLIANFDERKNL